MYVNLLSVFFSGRRLKLLSEKIYIPTDVQVQIFFQFHLAFTSASLEKYLYLDSATVLFQHTPLSNIAG